MHQGFAKLFDFGILQSEFRSHGFWEASHYSNALAIRSVVPSKEDLRLVLERFESSLKDVHDVDERAGTIFLRAQQHEMRN